MAMLAIAIAAVTLLGIYADRATPLVFELLIVLVGAGFGPVPSLTSVAMQNVVSRHKFGISIGTMNFSRNLYATMLIAVFGAIVLAGGQSGLRRAPASSTEAAHGSSPPRASRLRSLPSCGWRRSRCARIAI